MTFSGKILLLTAFLFADLLHAQSSFVLKVQDKEIGKADQLQVEYEVSNAKNVAGFATPDFADWNILSGPEYSQQTIDDNGKVSSSISYIFILQPKKTGLANVPAATIVADGKKLTCNAVVVNVSAKDHLANAQQQQSLVQLPPIFDDSQLSALEDNNVLKPNEKPDEKIRQNIFVKLTASKTSCYVGEPILVTYQLFSALEAEAKVNKEPTFSDCSVIEMTNPNEQPTVEKINGKTYRVATIRKVQLIPLQEGELKLEPATVDNNVAFSSPANPYQAQTYSATLSSNTLNIEVKNLPEKNKPENFSGVTGNFKISANADSTSIAAGENNILKIKIEGEGNFNGITQPAINWNNDLEHFEGTDSQHIDKTSFPSSGEISFQIPFIAIKEGRDTVPEISFSFFDPSTATYQTVHTEKIPLVIKKAIPANQKILNAVSEDLSNKNYLWIVAGIALGVAGFFIFSSGKKKTPSKNIIVEKKEEIKPIEIKEKIAEPVFKLKTNFTYELELLQRETESRQFFIRAQNILILILQAKTNEASNSTSALLSALPKYTNNEEAIADAENIYKVCNYSLYTPDVSDEEKILLQARLELLLKKLEV